MNRLPENIDPASLIVQEIRDAEHEDPKRAVVHLRARVGILEQQLEYLLKEMHDERQQRIAERLRETVERGTDDARRDSERAASEHQRNRRVVAGIGNAIARFRRRIGR